MAAPILTSRIRVTAVMRPGILSCPSDTLLREVARMMALHRIHCVIVGDPGSGDGAWGVLSDLDLARSVDCATEDTIAGEVAATDPVTLPDTALVDDAARLMAEHDTAHVVIVDRLSGDPLGVVSTLDVALALAGLVPGRAAE
jgi:CBS domain-containing protein